MSKKLAIKVQLDEDVFGKLNESAQHFGMTANALVSAIAYELSRVPKEHVWQAIGRVADASQAATIERAVLRLTSKGPQSPELPARRS